MKFDSKRGRWDVKFASRGSDLLPTEPFILRNTHLLKPGSLLDVACGDGRNAIPLAKHGFAVTGVDFSAVALGRLRRFAEQARLCIRLVEMDLEAMDSFLTLGAFDNIVVSHFMPPALFWSEVPQLLHPGGSLIFCTFNLKQHEAAGFPREYCLAPGQFETVAGLDLVQYETFTEGDRHLDGYVFRRSQRRSLSRTDE